MEYKDSEEKKWRDHNMNQMCDNLEKSSKVPFVTTPEKNVEDLIKRLKIKADMIQLGEGIAWGSDSAIMREALEEAGNYVDELYQSGNMGENEYMLLTDWFDEKLTQPNNPK